MPWKQWTDDSILKFTELKGFKKVVILEKSTSDVENGDISV